MAEVTPIYVPLADEGTDVWRPVAAEHVTGDSYVIIGEEPPDEKWIFPSGTVVRCEMRRFGDGGEARVAVEAVYRRLKMTFRQYLERRQAGDSEVRSFLQSSDPDALDARSWADLMWDFRSRGADLDYIETARRLHFEYSRALGKASEPRRLRTQKAS